MQRLAGSRSCQARFLWGGEGGRGTNLGERGGGAGRTGTIYNLYVCVYIHIYIYRERERGRERQYQ